MTTPTFYENRVAKAHPLPVTFAHAVAEPVVVHMKTCERHPLLVFVVSTSVAESTLIADLFSRAGHCPVPIHNVSLAEKTFWKTPPDMILLDEALTERERSDFRAHVLARTVARQIPVLDFSIRSIALNDKELEVGGCPFELLNGKRQASPGRRDSGR
jgi:hypothetical protein